MNKKIFKEVIQEIVDQGEYSPDHPRAFFIKSLIRYNKQAGNPVPMKRSLFGGYDREEALFTEIVDELEIKIMEGVLRKMSIVTNNMMSGAVAAEKRHRGSLGKDY